MIYINDKEVNFIYNLGEKVKEVFSYGTKIWPKEVLFDYMYFKLADGYTSGNVSYKFDEYYNLHNKYLKISTDGNNWSDWTEQISMTPNVKYFVKGEDDYVRNSDISGGFFTSDVSTQNFNIECGGNVMSLCNNVTEITVPYCLRSLFQKITNLVTAPKLPATTLKDNCYFGMFEGCSSLISTPELPATTLAVGCYEYMFQNCSSLTEVSRLPAMELKDKCYMCMFYSCSSLTQAPALPATTLSYCCYTGMFQGCSSLTQAPALPATTLVKECYRTMFNNCTSLTQAPALPATTLADYCYSYMFSGCTLLTQAPELPATTLANYCYTAMFLNSNKLNWIKAMFTTTPSTSYTKSWVNGVSAKGVFVKNINATWTTTGVNAVPTGWTVIYYDQTEGKYYTTKTKEVECDKYGNVKQEIDAMYFKLADGETSGNVSYQFNEYFNLHNKYLKYSTDGNNWQDWTEAISMSPNTKYYVKGEDSYVRNSNISSGFFSSDVSTQNFNIECGGNVMSLVNMNESITVTSCFSSLFYNMKNLLTPPTLPATTLADSCYNGMFKSCFSLTQAPELPATTLANYCYSYMFKSCISLTQAPELPATTLTEGCYMVMFDSCSKLVQASELPATTLADSCYNGMFNNSHKLNWIKALFTTKPSSQYTASWVNAVSANGVFVKNINANWTDTDFYAVPKGWKIIYFDKTEGKYYTTKTKEVECDKYGNPLH